MAIGLFKRLNWSNTTAIPAHHSPSKDVIFITNSFSADSGGLTASIFQRAKVLAEIGYHPHIATLNMKHNYGEIFVTLCEKHDVNGVDFLNPFPFFARGQIYSFVTESVANPANEDLQANEATRTDCIEFEEDAKVYRIRHRKRYTRDDALIEYVNPTNGEIYLEMYPGENARPALYRWKKASSKEPDCFLGRSEFLAYWFAHLETEYNHPVFLSEYHGFDDVLLVNPYLKHIKPCVIATIHSTLFSAPYTYGSPINDSLRPVLDRMSEYQAIITLTTQESKHIQNYYGVRDNIYTIPHPISFTKVESRRKPRSLVICSRLVNMKRIDHAILAMEHVVKALPDATLDIYGVGEAAESVENLISSLSLQENVRYLGYTNSPAQTLAQYSASLSTSLYEGIGLSTMESLSAGTPVIAYRYLYGPASLIVDGVNGRLVPNGDIGALANTVIETLRDASALERMSEAARRFDPIFSSETIRDSWASLLRGIREHEEEQFDPHALIIDRYNVRQAQFSEKDGIVSEKFRIRVFRMDISQRVEYYLNFNSKHGIDVLEELYVKAEVTKRVPETNAEYLSVWLQYPTDTYHALFTGDEELRLQVKYGKHSLFYPFRRDKVRVRHDNCQTPPKAMDSA